MREWMKSVKLFGSGEKSSPSIYLLLCKGTQTVGESGGFFICTMLGEICSLCWQIQLHLIDIICIRVSFLLGGIRECLCIEPMCDFFF